jgi:hypothetical protein
MYYLFDAKLCDCEIEVIRGPHCEKIYYRNRHKEGYNIPRYHRIILSGVCEVDVIVKDLSAY